MISDLFDQQKFKFVDEIIIGRFDIQVKAVEIETNQPVILSFWYKKTTSLKNNIIHGQTCLNILFLVTDR